MRKPWVPNSRSVISHKIWPCIHPFFPRYAPVSTPSSYCIGYRAIFYYRAIVLPKMHIVHCTNLRLYIWCNYSVLIAGRKQTLWHKLCSRFCHGIDQKGKNRAWKKCHTVPVWQRGEGRGQKLLGQCPYTDHFSEMGFSNFRSNCLSDLNISYVLADWGRQLIFLPLPFLISVDGENVFVVCTTMQKLLCS